MSMAQSVDSARENTYVTTTNSSDNRSLSARGRLTQNVRPGSSPLHLLDEQSSQMNQSFFLTYYQFQNGEVGLITKLTHV